MRCSQSTYCCSDKITIDTLGKIYLRNVTQPTWVNAHHRVHVGVGVPVEGQRGIPVAGIGIQAVEAAAFRVELLAGIEQAGQGQGRVKTMGIAIGVVAVFLLHLAQGIGHRPGTAVAIGQQRQIPVYAVKLRQHIMADGIGGHFHGLAVFHPALFQHLGIAGVIQRVVEVAGLALAVGHPVRVGIQGLHLVHLHAAGVVGVFLAQALRFHAVGVGVGGERCQPALAVIAHGRCRLDPAVDQVGHGLGDLLGLVIHIFRAPDLLATHQFGFAQQTVVLVKDALHHPVDGVVVTFIHPFFQTIPHQIIVVFGDIIQTVVGVVVRLFNQAAQLVINPIPGVGLALAVGEGFLGFAVILVVLVAVALQDRVITQIFWRGVRRVVGQLLQTVQGVVFIAAILCGAVGQGAGNLSSLPVIGKRGFPLAAPVDGGGAGRIGLKNVVAQAGLLAVLVIAVLIAHMHQLAGQRVLHFGQDDRGQVVLRIIFIIGGTAQLVGFRDGPIHLIIGIEGKRAIGIDDLAQTILAAVFVTGDNLVGGSVRVAVSI